MSELYHAAHKVCSLCQKEKPLTEFFKDRTHKDGYKAACKSCTNFRNKNVIVTQPPLLALSKVCTLCHIDKPLNAFPPGKGTLDLSSWCRECKNKRKRQKWADTHPDMVKIPPLSLDVPSGFCVKCHSEKPLEDFATYVTKYGTGHRRTCKICDSAIHKSQRLKNPEQYKSRARRTQKRLNALHPDRCREYRHRTYERHHEAYLAKNRQWYKDHPEYNQEKSIRRRAITLGATIGSVDYQRILKRDGNICHICGGKAARSNIHFDHVIPLTRGGAHSEENIKVSHAVCNLRKNNRLMEELTPFDRRGPDRKESQ